MREHPTADEPRGPRYARAKTLAARLDVHVSTLWRWVNEGRLPAPHKLGPGVSAFDLTEVEAALQERRP